MKYILKGIGAVLIIFAMWFGYMSYFAYNFSGSVGIDGFGRALEPAPQIIRMIFDTDYFWHGLTTEIFNVIIFFSALVAGYIFVGVLDEKSN